MITIKQGETYRKSITICYGDTREPVDLSGYSAYSEMRTTPGGTLVATATCSVNGSEGRVTALYGAGKTNAIPEGKYGFDIWIVNGGDQYPVYTAEVKIIGRYTETLSANES